MRQYTYAVIAVSCLALSMGFKKQGLQEKHNALVERMAGYIERENGKGRQGGLLRSRVQRLDKGGYTKKR